MGSRFHYIHIFSFAVLIAAAVLFLPISAMAQSSNPAAQVPAAQAQPQSNISGGALPPVAIAGPAAGSAANESPNAANEGTVAASPQSDPDAMSPANIATLENVQKSVTAHLGIDPNMTMPKNIKTLFYTAWQYALLVEARQSFKTRPTTGGGDSHGDPGPREISLGGIAFSNDKDWTIWLNSQRIKPDAIPPQVMNLIVARDYIDLKWFDRGSNLIYPIRLHPHERFNLDNRIFLPGAGTEKAPDSSSTASTASAPNPG